MDKLAGWNKPLQWEGYILKSASITQIAQSIDDVIKGGAAMMPSIALKVMRYFAARQVPAILPDYKLTKKRMKF